MTGEEQLESYWRALRTTIESVPLSDVASLMGCIDACHQAGGTVLTIGNGGSAATASHFVSDLLQMTSISGRAGVRSVCLNDNPAVVTALANDHGYETVFATQLTALLNPGDVLVAISTSGNSPNVIRAAEIAHDARGAVAALTGRGGRLAEIADYSVRVPSDSPQLIEDAHLAIMHSVCVALRATLAARNQVASAS